jgi:hypothetical protein
LQVGWFVVSVKQWLVSLSIATIAVSSAKFAVVDSGEVGRPAVYTRYNNGPRTLIQRGLDSMAAWCKHWNLKINEDKTRAINYTRQNRPPDSLLTLNRRNITFVNSLKYLGVLFDKRMTW